MKIYEEAVPIIITINKEKYFGVTCPPEDGKTKFYYKWVDNNYYFPSDSLLNDEIAIKKHPGSFSTIQLHAKLVTIDLSINILGESQRKKDLKGAVLQVVALKTGHNEEGTPFDYYRLATARTDGVCVNCMKEDLHFIYPTIHSTKLNPIVFSVGDEVITKKSDSANNFVCGEVGIITSIVASSHDKDLDILVCKNGEKDLIGYAKHFKKTK